MLHILDFVGHLVSVAATQFCGCSESSHRQYIKEGLWLYSCKALFIKTGCGLDLAHRVLSAEPCFKLFNFISSWCVIKPPLIPCYRCIPVGSF